MKPGGGGKPTGNLLKLIDRDFGSFEAFVEEFKLAASTQFGSGWAWLACEHFSPFPCPKGTGGISLSLSEFLYKDASPYN